MRAAFKTTMASTFATVIFGMVCASTANAQCANPAWRTPPAFQSQTLPLMDESQGAAFSADVGREGSDDRIVGFWKVKFVSEGNPGIPNDVVIDNAFAQWHGDGTEIMNSSRPPATGNFCLGVWQKSGPSSYDLNHFALSSDPAGNLVGPAQIREHVTLDDKAGKYEGTFTIDQYDLSGNPLAHITGRVTAARITVATSIADVL